MAAFGSLAEYYRHHREVMERALAEGITPRAAEIELQREQALAKHEALMAHLSRKRPVPPPAEAAEQPWMMRD